MAADGTRAPRGKIRRPTPGNGSQSVLQPWQNISVSVSVLTLSAISVERWYAICHPLAFKSTLSRARNTIIIIWIVAAAVALPDILVAEATPYKWPGEMSTVLLTNCKPIWDGWKQGIYQITIIVIMYVVPLILMALTYANIAIVLWRNDIPGQAEMGQYGKKPMIDGRGKSQEDKLQSRRKAARMLITIVIVFAICYLPVHLFNILRYFSVLKKDEHHANAVLSLICHWLPYFNSSLNPVIYNFMSAKFRKEFKLACWCCFKTYPRRRDGTFTMTFSNSNYSNCHTEEVTLTSFKD